MGFQLAETESAFARGHRGEGRVGLASKHFLMCFFILEGDRLIVYLDV